MPEVPPNAGFVAVGPGWVRLWLRNDDPGGPGRDLWVGGGNFYPLAVARYELDEAVEHPDALEFEDDLVLGGYTRSLGLDEAPYTDLPPNVGLYTCHDDAGRASIRSAQDEEAQVLFFAPGDFYAQDVRDVSLVEGSGLAYFFLVLP